MDAIESITAMANSLVEAGSVTREQADQMLASDIAALNGELPVTPDGTTAQAIAQQLEQDAQLPVEDDPLAGVEIDPAFAPPEKPTDYRLEFNTPEGRELSIDNIKEVQTWLHALKMPDPIAKFITSEVERMASSDVYSKMSDDECIMQNRRTMVDLRNVWGDRTDEMIGLGRRLVQEAAKKYPRILFLLEETRAGSNPAVIRQIAEQAARIYGKN